MFQSHSCELLRECVCRVAPFWGALAQMLAGGGARRTVFGNFGSFPPPCLVFLAMWLISCVNGSCHQHSQLSAMDVSVRSTMKGAAKCDKHCELQNSVNRQGLERILCFWDIPESTPASVSMLYHSSSCRLLRGMLLRVLVPQDALLVFSYEALLRHRIDKALLRQPAD